MKTILNIVFRLILLFIPVVQLQAQDIKRESILDNISHVEDSIIYKIDSLPMLCVELGMKGQFSNIGDCKLYYEERGEGAPLVVINGGPGGTHHCFHPWFEKAESFAKVIYYDQRGCGQSDYAPGKGYTFRQAVDDLDKLRQQLNIDKWIVCGYSYGGALAQYYTTVYPEHVMGLVMIGSSSLLPYDEPSGSRERMFISEEERVKIREIYSLYKQKKISLFQLIFNKELNGDWKRQSFYKPAKKEIIRASLYEWVNDKGFNPIMGEDYSNYNFKGVFDGNPIPTLICEGKWDLTWLPEKADILKRNHPNATLKFFENSGHTIFSEEPQLFFSTLANFIDSMEPISEDDIIKWKKHTTGIIEPQEN